MIVTLTPNPALDMTYHLDALAVGASQRVPPAQQRAGGKGINVARVLHDQGYATQVVAPVGGVTGAVLQADLDAAGLPHGLLEVAGATRHTLALVTPTETTNLNETGSGLTDTEWSALLDRTAAALSAPAGAAVDSSVAVLVCSGSMPPGTTPEILERLVRGAHERAATCVVDTSGDLLLVAADAGADVLKPNHHELLAVMGGDDVLVAARALAARSGGVVYASLGAAGLLRVVADGPALHARLGRSLVGNTTGAGDAAVAAIAASLSAGASPEDTLRLAVAWSAAAVLHPLAGSITDPAPLLTEIGVEPVDTAPVLED